MRTRNKNKEQSADAQSLVSCSVRDRIKNDEDGSIAAKEGGLDANSASRCSG